MNTSIASWGWHTQCKYGLQQMDAYDVIIIR